MTRPSNWSPRRKPGAVRSEACWLEGKPQPYVEVNMHHAGRIAGEASRRMPRDAPATFAQKGAVRCVGALLGTGSGRTRRHRRTTETRHYATLVFDAGRDASSQRILDRIRRPPESGGGTLSRPLPASRRRASARSASDGWLYVYGGHVVPTHNVLDGGRLRPVQSTESGRQERHGSNCPGGPAAAGNEPGGARRKNLSRRRHAAAEQTR